MKPLTTSICLLCVLSVSVGTRTSASISTRSAAFQISEIRSLSCHLFLYNGPVSSIRNNRGYCSLDEAYSICHSSFAFVTMDSNNNYNQPLFVQAQPQAQPQSAFPQVQPVQPQPTYPQPTYPQPSYPMPMYNPGEQPLTLDVRIPADV